LRDARARGFREFALSFLGFHPFRCRECEKRFLARPIGVRAVRWAKCPKCLRMDLGSWDPKHYRADWWADLQCWFGANRWRCEACRQNFVSWRPRRERYAARAGAENGGDKKKMVPSDPR
jgi:hypothetical protein